MLPEEKRVRPPFLILEQGICLPDLLLGHHLCGHVNLQAMHNIRITCDLQSADIHNIKVTCDLPCSASNA